MKRIIWNFNCIRSGMWFVELANIAECSMDVCLIASTTTLYQMKHTVLREPKRRKLYLYVTLSKVVQQLVLICKIEKFQSQRDGKKAMKNFHFKLEIFWRKTMWKPRNMKMIEFRLGVEFLGRISCSEICLSSWKYSDMQDKKMDNLKGFVWRAIKKSLLWLRDPVEPCS